MKLANILETTREPTLGARFEFHTYSDWKAALPKGSSLYKPAGGTVERAQALSKDFEGVAGVFDHGSNKGWIYEHYLNKANLREAVKGSWTVHNMSGSPKKFADAHSDAARAWARSHGPTEEERKRWDREEAKLTKAREKEDRIWDMAMNKKPRVPTKKEYLDMYNFAIDALGNSFPDGDPIDAVGPYLEKRKWNMDDLDKAFKMYGGSSEKKGMYSYLADMWADQQESHLYDVKNHPELADENSVFFYVDNNGKVIPHRNPWK